jgi:hypothetical protein
MVLLHHHSLARNFPGLKGIDAFAIERRRILISKRESLLGRWGLLAVHLMRDGPGFRGDFGVRGAAPPAPRRAGKSATAQ